VNLRELIDTFRSRVNDSADPPLWSDQQITGYFNEAQVEACVRARLIFDADSAFLSIPLVAGKGEYTIDPSILQNGIVDIYVDSYAGTTAPGFMLRGTNQSALDRDRWFHYRSQTGRPCYFMQDGHTLRLAPIPADTGTLRLAVYRAPTCNETLESDADEPVISNQLHLRLLDWALYLGYSDNDPEKLDLSKATLAESRFDSSFGKRVDANTERKRSERRSGVSAVNWPASYPLNGAHSYRRRFSRI
jgi:hypothetical protein